MLVQCAAGATTGMVTWLAVCPADVVKSRIQTRPLEATSTGTLATVREMLVEVFETIIHSASGDVVAAHTIIIIIIRLHQPIRIDCTKANAKSCVGCVKQVDATGLGMKPAIVICIIIRNKIMHAFCCR